MVLVILYTFATIFTISGIALLFLSVWELVKSFHNHDFSLFGLELCLIILSLMLIFLAIMPFLGFVSVQ